MSQANQPSEPGQVFALVADEILILLRPLMLAGDNPSALPRLLAGIGWAVPKLDAIPLDQLGAALRKLIQGVRGVIAHDWSHASLAELVAASRQIGELLASLQELEPIVKAAFAGKLTDAHAKALVDDIAQILVLRYLGRRAPGLLAVFHVLTIVEVETVPAILVGSWKARRSHQRAVLHLERLVDALRDPVGMLTTAYVPGGKLDSQAKAEAFVTKLFGRLRPLVGLAGGEILIGLSGASKAVGSDPSLAALARTASIGLPLPGSNGVDTTLWTSIEVLPVGIAGRIGSAGPGLEIEPVGVVSTAATLGTWTLALEVVGEVGRLFVSRDRAIAQRAVELRIDANLTRGSAAAPALILGSQTGTRIELGELEIAGFVDFDPASVDFGFGAAARKSKLVVAGGDGDSFLAEMLGEGLSIDFDLGLAWSKLGGLAFSGGAGFEVTIPIGLSLAGVFTVDSLELALRIDAEQLAIDAGVVVGLALGPFTAIVDGVGLSLDARFLAKPTGNLGPIDLSLAFKPPSAIGLAIDAGFAKGGGFLELGDHRYSGVLELELLEVGVTAAGVLVTEMPDGSEGWSLLLSLAATLPGIQLGFGFTLLGVGGLIGIHRGVDTDALAEGVRTGALARLLFPADPIGDAVELIAALESVFPVAHGQYVFGPIAKLGWGTPTLMTLELGVVIQLPEPLTISLLGSFEALLPSAELAILALRVDMAGTLDLTAGTLKIDAALRDSKVAGLTLTGAMAVRASFLDNPTFLISFGGFHPSFQPPADFPKLERLAVSLDAGDEVRVRLAGYFALTSNTVQFGAEASFWAKRVGFTAEGGTSFDALIQLAPFGFTIGIKAWLTVSAGDLELLGVLLEASLRGPTPWRVSGRAYFKLAGFKTHLEVDATIGKAESQPSPARENLLELVAAALAEPGAWAALPPSGREVVRLVEPSAGSIALAVHPRGRISLRQRVAPIGVTLEHHGSAAITGPTRLEFSNATLGGSPTRTTAIEDWFAAAQFFELSNAERLAAPSFESMQAGVILGDDAAAAGSACRAVFDHETIYADGRAPAPSVPKRGRGSLALALARVEPSAIRKSSSFALAPASWTVRDAGSGAVVAGSPANAGWFDARAKLREDPTLTVARVLAPTWENS